MKTETAKTWLLYFNDKVQANKDYLSELDTPIGDGDHGGNMARGMAAVSQQLKSQTFESAADIFKMTSMQLLSKVGGASGPLYGSAFMGMTKSEQNKESLSKTIKSGLEMIEKRGKASVNEKTMVDVWDGVVKALENDELTASKIDELVNLTKNMRATKGRASYVGERSIGHIDPGSFSSGLLFKALLEAEDI